MKTSPFARSIELAKLAAKVGFKELKSKDFQSRYEQALLIAKSLSTLKGAAMKVGQLLSLDLDNYFPPEAIEVLSQLQNAATAHPFHEIEVIIQNEIPHEKRKDITSISPKPLGVASIGQVHQARYRGQDIVLKVQYLNVADSIDSDLKILKTIALSFCQISGRKMDLDPLFLEFKSILTQEVDYKSEAEFLKIFQKKILELNKNSLCKYRVPKVIEEISTQKILAMSFEEGLTLRAWLNTNPSQTAKKKVAVAMLDLYFHEFFEWGIVQTDPNWGNFLIHEANEEISICLLDFGATRKYTKTFVRSYIELLDCASKNESEKLKELSIQFGLIDPRESEAGFKALEHMLKTSIRPFFSSQAGNAYFDFSDVNHILDSQESVNALTKELIFSPPPYTIIFLHRKLAGIYAILKSFEVQLDISPYWQMMNELATKEDDLNA